MELTQFNGTGPRHWIRHCNRYFEYFNTLEIDKVPLAALYFDEKVETWFYNHLVGRPFLSWDDLSRALLGKIDRIDYGRIVGSFNKLRQTTSVENYIASFEGLRATLLEFNPYMTESYLLHSFISGLQEEIRHEVDMFNPQTLELAFNLSEKEERKVEALRKRNVYSRGGSINNVLDKPSDRLNTKPKVVREQTTRTNTDFKKGVCFKCGEKWVPGRHCKSRTLHQIEGELQDEEIIAGTSLEGGENNGTASLNSIRCYTGNTGRHSVLETRTFKGGGSFMSLT